jgi:hypothetical protein
LNEPLLMDMNEDAAIDNYRDPDTDPGDRRSAFRLGPGCGGFFLSVE